MTTDEPKYWPFPIALPPEQLTDQHRKEIRFLETAFAAGFRPRIYLVGGGEYEASSEQGRAGWLISRGGLRDRPRARWEVRLDDHSGQAAAYWVDDFETAAASVLQWLEGKDATAIVDSARPRIVRGPLVVTNQPDPR